MTSRWCPAWKLLIQENMFMDQIGSRYMISMKCKEHFRYLIGIDSTVDAAIIVFINDQWCPEEWTFSSFPFSNDFYYVFFCSVKYVFNHKLAPVVGLPLNPEAAAKGKKILSSSLSKIESFWLKGSGRCLVGSNQPSIADLSLVCETMQLEVWIDWMLIMLWTQLKDKHFQNSIYLKSLTYGMGYMRSCNGMYFFGFSFWMRKIELD